MQVRTLNGAPLELRSGPLEFGSTDPLRARLMQGWSYSGVPVTEDRVFGLVGVLQCLRIASGMVAGMRPIIFESQKGDIQTRVEAIDSWQWKLFQNPSPSSTKYDFFSDLSASVDGWGNAYIQKIKGGYGRGKAKRVLELRILPAKICRAYMKDGEKLFAVRMGPRGGEVKDLGPDEILHIRGFGLGGEVMGASLMEQHRATLGNALAIQEYVGRYFSNDATPGGYIQLPSESNLDKTQLDEILEIWEERHAGVENKHRPAILQGGAEWHTTAMSAKDAALIEAQDWTVGEIARMCDLPVSLIENTKADNRKTEEVIDRAVAVHIKPRAERIKAALNEDQDLFWGTPLYIDYDYSKLRTADLDSQGNFDLRMRQGGILTANEIRAQQGYEPHADGDILQMTPVGGESNPGLQGDGQGGGAQPDEQPKDPV